MKTAMVNGVEYKLGAQVVRLSEAEQESLNKHERRYKWLNTAQALSLFIGVAGIIAGSPALSMRAPAFCWYLLCIGMLGILSTLAAMIGGMIVDGRLRNEKKRLEKLHRIQEGENYIFA